MTDENEESAPRMGPLAWRLLRKTLGLPEGEEDSRVLGYAEVLRARLAYLEAALVESDKRLTLGKASVALEEENARLREALLAVDQLLCDVHGDAEHGDHEQLTRIHNVLSAALQPAPEGAKLAAHEVQASWDRLREKVKAVGEDLPAVTFVRCDSCGAVLPRENIELHSPSGINQCRGGCAKPPPPEAALEDVCDATVGDFLRARSELFDARAQLAARDERIRFYQGQCDLREEALKRVEAQLAAALNDLRARQAGWDDALKRAEEAQNATALFSAQADQDLARAETAEGQLAEAVALLRHVDDERLNELDDPAWMKANADWAARVSAFLSRLDAAKPKQEGT